MILFKMAFVLPALLIIPQAFASTQKCREAALSYKAQNKPRPTGFLDLPPSIKRILYRANVDTIKKLTQKSREDLLQLGLSEREIQTITQALRRDLLPDPAIKKSRKFTPTR